MSCVVNNKINHNQSEKQESSHESILYHHLLPFSISKDMVHYMIMHFFSGYNNAIYKTKRWKTFFHLTSNIVSKQMYSFQTYNVLS